MTPTRAASRLWAPDRLQGLDLARGLAVVGMLAAHLLETVPFVWGEPRTWADIANGRSSILFAVLAGASIALVSGGRRARRGHALTVVRGRLAIRAGMIWLIGLLLVSTGVPVYVILPAYAILFLLALPLLSVPPAGLLCAAALGALVLPFTQVLLNALPVWSTPDGDAVAIAIGWHYPFTLWIVFLLAGLGIGRLDLASSRVQRTLLGVGGALAVVGYAAAALLPETEPTGPDDLRQALTAAAHSGGVFEVVGSGGFALAVIALCLLVCRTPVSWLLLPLRAVGSMPLTAYTAQILAWAVWAILALGVTRDLDGFRALDPFWPLTIGILLGCTAWALTLGRGPIEAAITRLSRWVAR